MTDDRRRMTDDGGPVLVPLGRDFTAASKVRRAIDLSTFPEHGIADWG